MIQIPLPSAFECDVWQSLAKLNKPILLYGMGNGADKILSVFAKRGIACADVYASDAFVRGQSFHGKTVLTYAAAAEKYADFAVVAAFGSSLPAVTEKIYATENERELFIPDVPACGDTLFTLDFYTEHFAAFSQAFDLLCDAESKRIYADLIRYKITGKPQYLKSAVSPGDFEQTLLHKNRYRVMIDAGAYVGDTAKRFIDECPNAKAVYAVEPDRRSYKKLVAYAECEARATVYPHRFGAWSSAATAEFAAAGNRNSGIGAQQQKRSETVALNTVDSLAVQNADFIKYDVEGAELEALKGSAATIAASYPDMLISAYHKSEDLFVLPIYLAKRYPQYDLYLRRAPSVPAWDINLYAVKKEKIE